MPSSSRETVLCRYHYDPLDRQNGCTVPQQPPIQLFLNKDRLTTEIHGASRWSFFQHDEQLLAQRIHRDANATTVLLATDQQRSVLNVLDTTQPNPLAYTPYGHRPAKNGLLSLLGFNGERPDSVTGHYHLGNGYRQFNPVLMRFNSPDSWSPFGEGGLNTYGYCDGEPISQSDPTGHFSLKLINLRTWLSSSKPTALSKSDMIKNFQQKYKKPNFTQKELNVEDKGLKSKYSSLGYRIKKESTTIQKNKLYLNRTISYDGFELKTQHSITMSKSRNTYVINPSKIYSVKYTREFEVQPFSVAKYSNEKIDAYGPMSFQDFHKATTTYTGTLQHYRQEIRMR